MRQPIRATAADGFSLGEFLRSVDVSAAGLDSPSVRTWMDLDPDGRIVATTGFELAGTEVLLRAVAVTSANRRSGRGTELVTFALQQAAADGARRAWLMSRRTPEFWRGLGFEPAEISQLTAALLTTEQVRDFATSGRLNYETGWVRTLD